MTLGKSLEDYLEAILILKNQIGVVRSIDVARQMNFSKPSVCHAVKELRKKGYLEMDSDSCLHLTENGLALAEQVYERHCFFTAQLVEMGVNPAQAEQDACRIEHVISDESFQKLKEAIQSNNKAR
ncbi:MAG: metal-dependent transcriptional regulator [Eubacteriales bacterium]|nr:metal-dependent transcriptional regulator [Eubacteriales bacterium]